jgi:ribosomal protein L23
MASYFKKFIPFMKKRLTDEELIEIWQRSNKDLIDYQAIVNQTSDKKKIEIAVEQTSNIKIKKLNDVNLLINFLRSLANFKDGKDKNNLITKNNLTF